MLFHLAMHYEVEKILRVLGELAIIAENDTSSHPLYTNPDCKAVGAWDGWGCHRTQALKLREVGGTR
jgi:hypothetical protein